MIEPGRAPATCAGWAALVAACTLVACDAPVERSERCEELDRDACDRVSACRAIVAYDVTREPDGGERCYAVAPAARDPGVLVRCASPPHGGTLQVDYAIEPASGRCLMFPVSSDVPAGWERCRDAMAECPP
ncbi:MAG: hypothetical protein KF729_32225 [Sandaracinaceae bacterium]|nr:hypothetical protein [Sandaracinaceae bacterium]